MYKQILKDLDARWDGFGFLCRVGLLSWPQLNERAQDGWKFSCGKMKGVDCRSHAQQCCRIPWEARSFDPKWKAVFMRKMRTMTSDELIEFVGRNCHWYPPWTNRTRMDMEKAIGRAAVHYYREGYLLLAFAPDLTVDQATALLRREYARTNRLFGPANPSPKQRARAIKQWLISISNFEEAESQFGGAKSVTFDRYRSIMDGIRLTSKHVPVWW